MNLGPVGLAFVLTLLLVFGIPGGGQIRALGWWQTLFASLLAGSSYKAAGGAFKIVPDFVGSIINTIVETFGVSLPALALGTAIFLLFKKLTTKQVGIIGIFFWYIAAGAGGSWAYLSDSIANVTAGLA